MEGSVGLATEICALGQKAHARGWVPGASGNFSAVVSGSPLELTITPSGRDKGALRPEDLVLVDSRGFPVRGGEPSAETPIHLAIVAARGAGAIAHTHSRAATILSDRQDAGVMIEGYELLKGLAGVASHTHREWLPIIENSQDWPAQVDSIRKMLSTHGESHGFLIRRHGLYTWGTTVSEAWRHLEVLEFLLDVLVRPLSQEEI